MKLDCKRVETDHAKFYYHDREIPMHYNNVSGNSPGDVLECSSLRVPRLMHADDILDCGSDNFIENVIKPISRLSNLDLLLKTMIIRH